MIFKLKQAASGIGVLETNSLSILRMIVTKKLLRTYGEMYVLDSGNVHIKSVRLERRNYNTEKVNIVWEDVVNAV